MDLFQLFLLFYFPILGSGMPLACSHGMPHNSPVWLKGPGHPIELVSPNYPNAPNSSFLTCTWEVRAEWGSRVSVTVLEASMGSSCFTNILSIYDDSPAIKKSILQYPGLKAQCGQNSFPPATRNMVAHGVVTIKFSQGVMDQGVRFKVRVEATQPVCPPEHPEVSEGVSCPKGPCCVGDDCCILNVGTTPKEISSPNYPYDSRRNQQCSYKVVAPKGSQVAINFLDMDMQRDNLGTCLHDHLLLEDTESSSFGVIGNNEKRFCGQHLPNYPAPSLLTSVGSSLLVKYITDPSDVNRGRGFKATVFAINPFCSSLSYSHQYGDSSCNATCSMTPPPPIPIPVSCDRLSMSITVTDLSSSSPVSGALINLTSVEEQALTFDESLISNLNGVASAIVAENRNYTISIAAEGYLAESIVIPVDWCQTKQCFCHPNVTIKLTPEPPITLCENATKIRKSFKVIDKYTKKNLEGATVSIQLMVASQKGPFIGRNLQTNKHGNLFVTIKKNGKYMVTIKRKGYASYQKEMIIDCDPKNCTSCKEWVLMPLVKKSCKKIQVIIHVRDKTTDEPIENAALDIKMGFSQLQKLLKTNSKGKAFPTIPVTGMIDVSVQAKGYLPHQREFNIKCDIKNCKKCRPVIVLVMVPIVNPCENKKVMIEVFDDVTSTYIESAVVNVVSNSIIIAEKVHTDENGKLDLHLNSAGMYKIDVSKERYDPISKMFEFNCTNTSLLIPLKPEICQKTYFEMIVADGVTKAPLPNVSVSVSFESSETPISNFTTGSDGLAILEVNEFEEYTITVTKDGYISHELQHTLTDCTTSFFFVTLIRKPCDQGSRTISIFVSDKNTTLPLKGASASFLLTSNAAGPANENLGTHDTSDEGLIVVPVSLFSIGHYSISVSMDKYLDKTFELGIFKDENCTDITAEIALEKLTVEAFTCHNKTLEIIIIDFFSNKTIAGASVTISLMQNVESAFDMDELFIGQNLETNSNGEIILPVNAYGNYSISVEAVGYEPASGMVGVDCSSDLTIITIVMKPPCEPEFPVTVIDEMTKEPIEDAQVTIALMSIPNSLNTFEILDKQETSEEGLVNFVLKENGKYAVKVEADGYISNETLIVLNCESDTCDCPISLMVNLKKEFCTNISLTVIVRETMKNLPLVGAQLSVKLDTGDGTKDIATETVDDTGIVSILLPANGFYAFKVTHPQYMTITEEREISIAMGECKIPLEPIFLPMPPKITCPNGVVVSLTWNEHPLDMDLYSYKVGQKDSSHRCLSYYCDGKDPCDCVKFDKDNKEGGLKGSETISYCCTDDASHMIYADDLSGKGAYMFNSEASLTITNKNNDIMKFDMNTNGMIYNSSHRYWFAGCLTFGNGNFKFLPVNRFHTVKPHEEETLYCHHRTKLKSESTTKTDSSIHVIVKDAISNLPISGALVHVSLDGDSSFSDQKITNADGIVDIATRKNGKYLVRAEHFTIITINNDVLVNCISNNPCSVSTLLSASPEMQPGNVRIIMNWMEQPADLDLYTFQISMDNSLKTCLTSPHNTEPCNGVSMNLDNKAGGLHGSETISFYEVAENSRYTYMVFVDDKSGEGGSLQASKARLTITDSTKSTKIKMPAFDQSTIPGARYWFAGCMMIKDNSYYFVPENRFTKEKPSEEDTLECHNHFEEPIKNSGPKVHENSNIKIIVKDGLSNRPIGNATASLNHIEEEVVEVVASNIKTDEEGIIILPVKTNGKYAITVQGDGYIEDTIELTIACDTNDCHKNLLISLSPLLEKDSIRLMMNWETNPSDLDIHVYQVNKRNTEESCTTNWMGKTNCQGLTLDLDNRNGGDEGAETITFKNISQNNNFIYMIYVDDHSNDPKQFRTSETRLTVTDGNETIIVNMKTNDYKKETFWLAGCMRFQGSQFEFKEVGVFFQHSPKDDIRLHCFEVFGISTVPTIVLKGGWRKNKEKKKCQGNVYVNDMPVCDDRWSNKDAQVIGRMLGLNYKKCKAMTQSRFGSVRTNFIMDNVRCTGREKNILDCDHTTSEGHDCTTNKGAGVNCC